MHPHRNGKNSINRKESGASSRTREWVGYPRRVETMIIEIPDYLKRDFLSVLKVAAQKLEDRDSEFLVCKALSIKEQHVLDSIKKIIREQSLC